MGRSARVLAAVVFGVALLGGLSAPDFGSTPVKHQAYTWNGAGEYRYLPVRLIGSR